MTRAVRYFWTCAVAFIVMAVGGGSILILMQKPQNDTIAAGYRVADADRVTDDTLNQWIKAKYPENSFLKSGNNKELPGGKKSLDDNYSGNAYNSYEFLNWDEGGDHKQYQRGWAKIDTNVFQSIDCDESKNTKNGDHDSMGDDDSRNSTNTRTFNIVPKYTGVPIVVWVQNATGEGAGAFWDNNGGTMEGRKSQINADTNMLKTPHVVSSSLKFCTNEVDSDGAAYVSNYIVGTTEKAGQTQKVKITFGGTTRERSNRTHNAYWNVFFTTVRDYFTLASENKPQHDFENKYDSVIPGTTCDGDAVKRVNNQVWYIPSGYEGITLLSSNTGLYGDTNDGYVNKSSYASGDLPYTRAMTRTKDSKVQIKVELSFSTRHTTNDELKRLFEEANNKDTWNPDDYANQGWVRDVSKTPVGREAVNGSSHGDGSWNTVWSSGWSKGNTKGGVWDNSNGLALSFKDLNQDANRGSYQKVGWNSTYSVTSEGGGNGAGKQIRYITVSKFNNGSFNGYSIGGSKQYQWDQLVAQQENRIGNGGALEGRYETYNSSYYKNDGGESKYEMEYLPSRVVTSSIKIPTPKQQFIITKDKDQSVPTGYVKAADKPIQFCKTNSTNKSDWKEENLELGADEKEFYIKLKMDEGYSATEWNLNTSPPWSKGNVSITSYNGELYTDLTDESFKSNFKITPEGTALTEGVERIFKITLGFNMHAVISLPDLSKNTYTASVTGNKMLGINDGQLHDVTTSTPNYIDIQDITYKFEYQRGSWKKDYVQNDLIDKLEWGGSLRVTFNFGTWRKQYSVTDAERFIRATGTFESSKPNGTVQGLVEQDKNNKEIFYLVLNGVKSNPKITIGSTNSDTVNNSVYFIPLTTFELPVPFTQIYSCSPKLPVKGLSRIGITSETYTDGDKNPQTFPNTETYLTNDDGDNYYYHSAYQTVERGQTAWYFFALDEEYIYSNGIDDINNALTDFQNCTKGKLEPLATPGQYRLTITNVTDTPSFKMVDLRKSSYSVSAPSGQSGIFTVSKSVNSVEVNGQFQFYIQFEDRYKSGSYIYIYKTSATHFNFNANNGSNVGGKGELQSDGQYKGAYKFTVSDVTASVKPSDFIVPVYSAGTPEDVADNIPCQWVDNNNIGGAQKGSCFVEGDSIYYLKRQITVAVPKGQNGIFTVGEAYSTPGSTISNVANGGDYKFDVGINQFVTGAKDTNMQFAWRNSPKAASISTLVKQSPSFLQGGYYWYTVTISGVYNDITAADFAVQNVPSAEMVNVSADSGFSVNNSTYHSSVSFPFASGSVSQRTVPMGSGEILIRITANPGYEAQRTLNGKNIIIVKITVAGSSATAPYLILTQVGTTNVYEGILEFNNNNGFPSGLSGDLTVVGICGGANNGIYYDGDDPNNPKDYRFTAKGMVLTTQVGANIDGYNGAAPIWNGLTMWTATFSGTGVTGASPTWSTAFNNSVNLEIVLGDGYIATSGNTLLVFYTMDGDPRTITVSGNNDTFSADLQVQGAIVITSVSGYYLPGYTIQGVQTETKINGDTKTGTISIQVQNIATDNGYVNLPIDNERLGAITIPHGKWLKIILTPEGAWGHAQQQGGCVQTITVSYVMTPTVGVQTATAFWTQLDGKWVFVASIQITGNIKSITISDDQLTNANKSKFGVTIGDDSSLAGWSIDTDNGKTTPSLSQGNVNYDTADIRVALYRSGGSATPYYVFFLNGDEVQMLALQGANANSLLFDITVLGDIKILKIKFDNDPIYDFTCIQAMAKNPDGTFVDERIDRVVFYHTSLQKEVTQYFIDEKDYIQLRVYLKSGYTLDNSGSTYSVFYTFGNRRDVYTAPNYSPEGYWWASVGDLAQGFTFMGSDTPFRFVGIVLSNDSSGSLEYDYNENWQIAGNSGIIEFKHTITGHNLVSNQPIFGSYIINFADMGTTMEPNIFPEALGNSEINNVLTAQIKPGHNLQIGLTPAGGEKNSYMTVHYTMGMGSYYLQIIYRGGAPFYGTIYNVTGDIVITGIDFTPAKYFVYGNVHGEMYDAVFNKTIIEWNDTVTVTVTPKTGITGTPTIDYHIGNDVDSGHVQDFAGAYSNGKWTFTIHNVTDDFELIAVNGLNVQAYNITWTDANPSYLAKCDGYAVYYNGEAVNSAHHADWVKIEIIPAETFAKALNGSLSVSYKIGGTSYNNHAMTRDTQGRFYYWIRDNGLTGDLEITNITGWVANSCQWMSDTNIEYAEITNISPTPSGSYSVAYGTQMVITVTPKNAQYSQTLTAWITVRIGGNIQDFRATRTAGEANFVFIIPAELVIDDVYFVALNCGEWVPNKYSVNFIDTLRPTYVFDGHNPNNFDANYINSDVMGIGMGWTAKFGMFIDEQNPNNNTKHFGGTEINDIIMVQHADAIVVTVYSAEGWGANTLMLRYTMNGSSFAVTASATPIPNTSGYSYEFILKGGQSGGNSTGITGDLVITAIEGLALKKYSISGKFFEADGNIDKWTADFAIDGVKLSKGGEANYNNAVTHGQNVEVIVTPHVDYNNIPSVTIDYVYGGNNPKFILAQRRVTDGVVTYHAIIENVGADIKITTVEELSKNLLNVALPAGTDLYDVEQYTTQYTYTPELSNKPVTWYGDWPKPAEVPSINSVEIKGSYYLFITVDERAKDSTPSVTIPSNKANVGNTVVSWVNENGTKTYRFLISNVTAELGLGDVIISGVALDRIEITAPSKDADKPGWTGTLDSSVSNDFIQLAPNGNTIKGTVQYGADVVFTITLDDQYSQMKSVFVYYIFTDAQGYGDYESYYKATADNPITVDGKTVLVAVIPHINDGLVGRYVRIINVMGFNPNTYDVRLAELYGTLDTESFPSGEPYWVEDELDEEDNIITAGYWKTPTYTATAGGNGFINEGNARVSLSTFNPQYGNSIVVNISTFGNYSRSTKAKVAYLMGVDITDPEEYIGNVRGAIGDMDWEINGMSGSNYWNGILNGTLTPLFAEAEYFGGLRAVIPNVTGNVIILYVCGLEANALVMDYWYLSDNFPENQSRESIPNDKLVPAGSQLIKSFPILEGNPSSQQIDEHDAKYAFTLPTPKKFGYTFKQWNLVHGDDLIPLVGGDLNINHAFVQKYTYVFGADAEAVDFFAEFVENTYNISYKVSVPDADDAPQFFDAVGNYNVFTALPTLSVRYGSLPLELLSGANMVLKGYHFTQWNLSYLPTLDLNGYLTQGNIQSLHANPAAFDGQDNLDGVYTITLIAVFAQNSVEIFFDHSVANDTNPVSNPPVGSKLHYNVYGKEITWDDLLEKLTFKDERGEYYIGNCVIGTNPNDSTTWREGYEFVGFKLTGGDAATKAIGGYNAFIWEPGQSKIVGDSFYSGYISGNWQGAWAVLTLTMVWNTKTYTINYFDYVEGADTFDVEFTGTNSSALPKSFQYRGTTVHGDYQPIVIGSSGKLGAIFGGWMYFDEGAHIWKKLESPYTFKTNEIWWNVKFYAVWTPIQLYIEISGGAQANQSIMYKGDSVVYKDDGSAASKIAYPSTLASFSANGFHIVGWTWTVQKYNSFDNYGVVWHSAEWSESKPSTNLPRVYNKTQYPELSFSEIVDNFKNNTGNSTHLYIKFVAMWERNEVEFTVQDTFKSGNNYYYLNDGVTVTVSSGPTAAVKTIKKFEYGNTVNLSTLLGDTDYKYDNRTGYEQVGWRVVFADGTYQDWTNGEGNGVRYAKDPSETIAGIAKGIHDTVKVTGTLVPIWREIRYTLNVYDKNATLGTQTFAHNDAMPVKIYPKLGYNLSIISETIGGNTVKYVGLYFGNYVSGEYSANSMTKIPLSEISGFRVKTVGGNSFSTQTFANLSAIKSVFDPETAEFLYYEIWYNNGGTKYSSNVAELEIMINYNYAINTIVQYHKTTNPNFNTDRTLRIYTQYTAQVYNIYYKDIHYNNGVFDNLGGDSRTTLDKQNLSDFPTEFTFGQPATVGVPSANTSAQPFIAWYDGWDRATANALLTNVSSAGIVYDPVSGQYKYQPGGVSSITINENRNLFGDITLYAFWRGAGNTITYIHDELPEEYRVSKYLKTSDNTPLVSYYELSDLPKSVKTLQNIVVGSAIAYTFMGWQEVNAQLQPVGAIQNNAINITTMGTDRYFKSKWQVTQYNVIYNYIIGAITTYQDTVDFNTKYETIPPSNKPTTEMRASEVQYNYANEFTALSGGIGGAVFQSTNKYAFMGWSDGTKFASTANVTIKGNTTYTAIWRPDTTVYETVLNNLERADRTNLGDLANYNLLTLMSEARTQIEDFKKRELINHSTYNLTAIENNFNAMIAKLRAITTIINGKVTIANIKSVAPVNTARLSMTLNLLNDYKESFEAKEFPIPYNAYWVHKDALNNIVKEIGLSTLTSENWDAIYAKEKAAYDLFVAMGGQIYTVAVPPYAVGDVKILNAPSTVKAKFKRYVSILHEYESDITSPWVRDSVYGNIETYLEKIATQFVSSSDIRGWVNAINENAMPYMDYETELAYGEAWLRPKSKPATTDAVNAVIEMGYRIRELENLAGENVTLFFNAIVNKNKLPAILAEPRIASYSNLTNVQLYDYKLELETMVNGLRDDLGSSYIAADGLPCSLPVEIGETGIIDPNMGFFGRLETVCAVFRDYLTDPRNEPNNHPEYFNNQYYSINNFLARASVVLENGDNPNKSLRPKNDVVRALVREASQIAVKANEMYGAGRGYMYTFGGNDDVSPRGTFNNKNTDPSYTKLTDATRTKIQNIYQSIQNKISLGEINPAEHSGYIALANQAYAAVTYSPMATEQRARVLKDRLEKESPVPWDYETDLPTTGKVTLENMTKLINLIYFLESVLDEIEDVYSYEERTIAQNKIAMARAVAFINGQINMQATNESVLIEIRNLEQYISTLSGLSGVSIGPGGEVIVTPKPAVAERARLDITVQITSDYIGAPSNLHGLRASYLEQLEQQIEVGRIILAGNSATAARINDQIDVILDIIRNIDRLLKPTGENIETIDGVEFPMPLGGRDYQITLLNQYIAEATAFINQYVLSEELKSTLFVQIDAAQAFADAQQSNPSTYVQEIWKTRRDLKAFLASNGVTLVPPQDANDEFPPSTNNIGTIITIASITAGGVVLIFAIHPILKISRRRKMPKIVE